MSDENSFGTVATQAPPSETPVDAAVGRSSRPLFIAGGVALLVLAVFAYVLFGTGSGEPEALGPVTVPVVPAPEASTPAAPEAAPEAAAPEAADVEGRDPFVPLEVQAVEETSTTTTDTTTDGTTTTPAVPAGETVTLTLVAVKSDSVNTEVGSKKYKGLAVGDTFGSSFQVYAIFNGSCAGFLYGDESFALCEGGSTTLAKL